MNTQTQKPFATGMVDIDVTIEVCRDEIAQIREMLVCGLQAVGEITKALDAIERHEIGEHAPLPDDIKPLHPFGDSDWLSQYAGALRTVEMMDSQCVRAANANHIEGA